MKRLVNILLLSAALLMSLLTGELAVRVLDGYKVLTLELQRSVPISEKQGDYNIKQFVREFDGRGETDSAWLHEEPPLLPKYEILEENKGHNRLKNYIWNKNYVTKYKEKFKDLQEVKIFEAPWGTEFPAYRYPTRVTLASGLTTNTFGWRGREISLNKPRNTIRIACVGSSTTVSSHGFPYSYPELLEHWLNLWSTSKKLGVQFEVINAGREGINSNSIEAIVKYELIPLEPDYVIYYEGANQFNTPSMVRYPKDVVFGQPPKGIVPELNEIKKQDNDKANFVKVLGKYSAIGVRIKVGLEHARYSGKEPVKPSNEFYLPAGIDELNPDTSKVKKALNLEVILKDLDSIKANLEESGGKMFLSTFSWFVYDGMVLNLDKHRSIYVYLNRIFWPMTYRNMERMALFQNRVFSNWASANNIPVIDIARYMPRHPDLYIDAIHNTSLGVKIRAWITLQSILPVIKADIQSGRLPVPDREFLNEHPYIKQRYVGSVKLSSLK